MSIVLKFQYPVTVLKTPSVHISVRGPVFEHAYVAKVIHYAGSLSNGGFKLKYAVFLYSY